MIGTSVLHRAGGRARLALRALDQAKPLLKLFDQIGMYFTGDPVPAASTPLLPIVYVR